MQATGRMAGQAGPTVYQAVGALLAATALVVGLTLAAQRISIGGAAVAAPAPDAASVERALSDHRLSEKGALLEAAKPGGTWTGGDVAASLQGFRAATATGTSSISNPAAWRVPFDQVAFRAGEKAPLSSADKPDATRRGTIAHR